MNKLRTHLVWLSLLCALVLCPGLAFAAAPLYAGPASTSRFVFFFDYLTAGSVYTYDTRNLNGALPDTVIHVLNYSASPIAQVAGNDDSGGTLASSVTFTAPTTGYYIIWVHAFYDDRGGRADLYRNGSVVLTQAEFGGRTVFDSWSAGDTFRAPGTLNRTNLDTMVFLLRDINTYLRHDDDSGPTLYPHLTTSSSDSGRVVYGSYPGTTLGNAALLHDAAIAGNDADGDGISNDMENLLGGNASKSDTDSDTIPDNLELFGNDGWSFSEWVQYTKRDVVVEADYMVHPSDATKTRQPYANLPADAAEIFNTDGNINLTLLIDNALPWHEVTCFGACAAGVVDGIDFYTLKSGHFSASNAERRPYLHYAVWAYRHTSNTNGSSGLAEIWGNDLIVSLGAWSHTQGQQRGTFVHELGHNLNLTHWGNGNNNGNNSTIHESVMNYRYQIGGVPLSGRHTYSTGPNNQCAACQSSPKQACINCQAAGQCGVGACVTCDCDLDEWSSVNLDFRQSAQANDGVVLAAASTPDEKLRPQVAPALAAEVPAAARARRIADLIAQLKGRGEVEGKDFLVSPDRLHVYAVCP